MNSNTKISVSEYSYTDNRPIIQLIIDFFKDDIITIGSIGDLNNNFFLANDKKSYIEQGYIELELGFVGFGKGNINELVEDHSFLLYILSIFQEHGRLFVESSIKDGEIKKKVLIAFTYKDELKTVELEHSNICNSFYHMFELIGLKSLVYELLLLLRQNNITISDIKNSDKIKKESDE